ncbi:MAG: sigma-70 family RNA polymerase sigma factor [Bacteroidia bacterium]
MPEILTEAQIVALLTLGDVRAIDQIYHQYGPNLLGVIFRIVGDQETAEDVLQDAFVKVWKNAAGYDAAKGRLFTWLLNICRNTAIDRIRSAEFKFKQKIQNPSNPVSTLSESQTYSFNPDNIGVKEWVKTLRPEYAEVIEIVYMTGYTHEEAAEKLGIPLGTLKTRLRAALKTLRENLNP